MAITLKEGSRILHAQHGIGIVNAVDAERVEIYFAPTILDDHTPSVSRVKSRLSYWRSLKHQLQGLTIYCAPDTIKTKSNIWMTIDVLPKLDEVVKLLTRSDSELQSQDDIALAPLRRNTEGVTASPFQIGQQNVSPRSIARNIAQSADKSFEHYLTKIEQKSQTSLDFAITDMEALVENLLDGAYKYRSRSNTAEEYDLDFIVGSALNYIMRNSSVDEIASAIAAIESALQTRLTASYKKKALRVLNIFYKRQEQQRQNDSRKRAQQRLVRSQKSAIGKAKVAAGKQR